MEKYLKTIKEKEHLKAIIELNPDLKENPVKGPLHNIPVLIKDNINTTGMVTSAGSVALGDNKPEDAPIITLLKEAGAIISGKANMTEFANYMVDFRKGKEEAMPNGYSSRGGQCLHPANPEADPSGSSTGSAVAVAADMVPMAIGSETYGSIISPAQCCGVVGIKPTAASVNMEGIIPISTTLDIVGPMAKTIEDAALLLGVIQNKTYQVTPKNDAKIGMYFNFMENAKPGWFFKISALLEELCKKGAEVFMTDEKIKEDFVFDIMHYEFKAAMNTYLEKYSTGVKTLEEIINYNLSHKETALKYGQSNLVFANEVTDNWAEEEKYINALKNRAAATETLNNIFDKHNLDVMVLMSAHCGLAAAVGFPSITLPLGLCFKGLPIGCCLMARPGEEQVLINVAKAL